MRTLQEKYNGIQEGKFSKDHFLVEARMQQPQLITRFNGYEDAVQILKNRGMIVEDNLGHNEISSIHQEGGSWIVTYRKDGTKEKVFKTEKEARDFEKTLSESKLTKKSLTDYRYKPTNDMDKYPYEQILRGIRVELEVLGVHGTPTAEEYSKALTKVSKNLAKDSIFYTNQLAGVNPKVDLHDKMVDVTAKNTVDTFNGMKKIGNLKEDHSANPDDKYIVRPCKNKKEPWAVWEGETRVKGFATKAAAKEYADSQNKKQGLSESTIKEGFKRLIKKVLSEAKGDMFGDKETAARADKYGDYGSDIEYEYFSDPENYNEEDEQVDESKMGDIYILAQESSTLRDFLTKVKHQHPETDLRRDIEELQHIWKNRGEVSENYDTNYGMDGDDDYDGYDESIRIEGTISPKMANGFKIGNKIKTKKDTYTITGFGSKTNATRDFEAKNEKGEQVNLRVSLRGATGIQVAPGKSLNFPEQEEMLEQVDESKMSDVYQIAQESDTLRDFLIAVKKQHPETDLRRDIEELQHIWKNRGEVSENYYTNYGMDGDDEEEGDDTREGLNIFGRTQIDNNEINNVLEELGLYGEWDAKAGSWFLPEEEENYDALEEMLEQEFARREINARFEGVFSDRNQIEYQDQEEDIYEGKQSLSELLK